MINIKLNKPLFVSRFLEPLSKITERCIINIKPNGVVSVVTTEDDNIILLAILSVKNCIDSTETIKLNISNIKKLTHILNCIKGDDIELFLDQNSLNYKSGKIKFKYHLLEDGIIRKPPIKIEKITQLPYDCSFDLTKDYFNLMLKGTLFANESNKIYFYTQDNTVYGELTDKKLQNFEGTEIKEILPINIDVFRMLKGLKFEKLKCKISNETGFLLVEVTEDQCALKYVIPAEVE